MIKIIIYSFNCEDLIINQAKITVLARVSLCFRCFFTVGPNNSNSGKLYGDHEYGRCNGKMNYHNKVDGKGNHQFKIGFPTK